MEHENSKDTNIETIEEKFTIRWILFTIMFISPLLAIYLHPYIYESAFIQSHFLLLLIIIALFYSFTIYNMQMHTRAQRRLNVFDIHANFKVSEIQSNKMRQFSEIDQADPEYASKMYQIHSKTNHELSTYAAQRKIDKHNTTSNVTKFKSTTYTAIHLTATLMILGAMILLLQSFPLTNYSILGIIVLSILLSTQSAHLIYDTHHYLKEVNLQLESPLIANTILISAFIMSLFNLLSS